MDLDSSKLKEFADNDYKFDENGRKFSRRLENAVGKGEIARYKQFLLFPVFSKGLFPRGVKRCHCVVLDSSNIKEFQTTITYLMKMAESSPKG